MQARIVADTEKRMEYLFDRLAASSVPDIALAHLVTISQGSAYNGSHTNK
jgi:hypothetical protein